MHCPSMSLNGRVSLRHGLRPSALCTPRPLVRRPSCASKPSFRTPISLGRELRVQCAADVQQNGTNGASAPKQTVAYHDGLQVGGLCVQFSWDNRCIVFNSGNLVFLQTAHTGEVPFKKILCANRGEIAIRVFRAGAEMGLRTVSF